MMTVSVQDGKRKYILGRSLFLGLGVCAGKRLAEFSFLVRTNDTGFSLFSFFGSKRYVVVCDLIGSVICNR